MEIAKLSERITVQKQVACKDSVGNRWNDWQDYFSCAAYASTYETEEQEEVAETLEQKTVIFTIRWCSEVSHLDATHYRILFRGDIYDIQAVDPVNYSRKTMKLKCSMEIKRGEVE
jgi:SPP1 family predicted phage head-tail adaptor